MKKLLSVLMAAAMLMASFAAVHAEDDIKLLLDGSEVAFDVPPQIIESRTFVPMRAIFEVLGAEVKWDDTTKSVTAEKDGTDIIMIIGSEMMFVNYSPVTLDAPPQIIDGRTLVPVRAIAESLDCDVDWDGDTRTVVITSAAEETPELSEEYTIEYDDSMEARSSLAKNFKITSITKNSDGKYEITYTVQTYRDSSGNVFVQYKCYDETGAEIDGFAGYFYSWAYSWTEQEGSAVISGRTAKIRLASDDAIN